MSEGFNPTRRFKWFRPRQAARGLIDFQPSTNLGTVALYNDSTGAQYLIVRDFQKGSRDGEGTFLMSAVNAKIGTQAGKIINIVPDTGKIAGILTQLDTATVYPPDYDPMQVDGNNQATYWNHEFPFQVLPPGWSLVRQSSANLNRVVVMYLWEAVEADELDFAFEL